MTERDRPPQPITCRECGNAECLPDLALCVDCLTADVHVPVLQERCRVHRG